MASGKHNDDGRPPAEPAKGPFPFLRRGAGTKQYSHINYINKTNNGRPTPPDNASRQPLSTMDNRNSSDYEYNGDSRGAQSVLDDADVAHFHSPQERGGVPDDVPRLDMHQMTSPEEVDGHRHRLQSDRDSGKGSGSSPPRGEVIYQPPSHRRPDSGYCDENGPMSPVRQRDASYSPPAEDNLRRSELGHRHHERESVHHNDHFLHMAPLIPETSYHDDVAEETKNSIIDLSNHDDEATENQSVCQSLPFQHHVEPANDTASFRAREERERANESDDTRGSGKTRPLEESVEERGSYADSKIGSDSGTPSSLSGSLSYHGPETSTPIPALPQQQQKASPSGVIRRHDNSHPHLHLSDASDDADKTLRGEPSDYRQPSTMPQVETAVLDGTPPTSHRGSRRVHRDSTSSSSTSFRISPLSKQPSIHTSDSSASSIAASDRELIAPRDRPLHEAYPSSVGFQRDSRSRPPVLPSESTRYPATAQHQSRQTMTSDQHIAPVPIHPRRVQTLIRNEQPVAAPRRRNVATEISPAPTTDSGSMDAGTDAHVHHTHTTPRPIRSRSAEGRRVRTASCGHDSPVLFEALMRQLRDQITHLDLAESGIAKEKKKLVDTYNRELAALARGREKLDEMTRRVENERENNQLETQRERRQLAKDREVLGKREKEVTARDLENEKKWREANIKAGRKASELMTKLAAKDREIKELSDKLESLEQSRARLERINKSKQKSHANDLKAKDSTIAQLQRELDAASRRTVGLNPRPRTSTSSLPPSSSSSLAPPPSQPPSNQVRELSTSMVQQSPRRQVRFNAEPSIATYINDNTFDSTDRSLSPTGNNELRLIEVTDQLPKGVCATYADDLDIRHAHKYVHCYAIRHNDESDTVCGAQMLQYHNSDIRFLYGPLEVYYFGYLRLVVKLRCLGVEIRCLMDQVEIVREDNEISVFHYGTNKVTETRRRRDGRGHYALVFHGGLMDRIGKSDRSQEFDAQVIRRGSVSEKNEYLELQPCVHWTSQRTYKDIAKWEVFAETNGTITVKVAFNNQNGIEVAFNAGRDAAVIRHLQYANGTTSKHFCCDIGKAVRQRERDGVFVACAQYK